METLKAQIKKYEYNYITDPLDWETKIQLRGEIFGLKLAISLIQEMDKRS